MQTKHERKKKTKKEHKLIIRDLKAAKDPKAGVLIKEQFALKY